MAEGKDIEIRMKATADTAGAQRMEEALEGVNAAAAENPMLKGKAEADARRAAERETAEAIDAQAAALQKAAAAAKAVEKLGEATKETALELPALGEADVIAEGVERLGKGSADAAVKSGGLGRALAGLVGNLNLYATALSLGWQAAKGWYDSQKALNDIAEIGADDIDKLTRSANMAAAAEQAAARSAESLAAARKQAEQITRQSTEAEGAFHEALAETLRRETEIRSLRDIIADKEMAADLAKAEGDPEAQAAIREKARQAAAAREREDLAKDIARQRAIKEQAAAEFALLDEQESAARGKAGELDGKATAQEQAAEQRRELADKAEEQRQYALKRKAEAEAVAGNFWTPTAMKNIAKDIIADEKGNAEELEKQREAIKNRATELEGLAKATRELAEAESKAAENLARRRDAVNETYGQATKEEERLTTTVKPFVDRKQGLENETAAALAESRGRAESERLREQRERDAEKAARDRESKLPRETRADLTGAEAAATGAADNALEGTRGSRFFPPVEKARKALADGGTGEEFAELASELDGFVNALTNIDAKKKANIAAVAKQFRDLAERVKRLENE